MFHLNNGLIFIKSKYIKVYPCGRRSACIVEDTSYIPFDPEARLNTELNNRKHTSLNGFADTYIKSWNIDSGELTLVLDGYDFVITLKDDSLTQDLDTILDLSNPITFVDEFFTTLNMVTEVSSQSKIYANIRIEEIPLLNGANLDYSTWILRNQSETKHAESNLDLLISAFAEPRVVDNYYFSGLSFTCSPLTGDKNTLPYSVLETTTENGARQKIISLCILDNLVKKHSDDSLKPMWTVHEPAYLPVIKHGDFAGAVAVEKLAANKSINAESIYLDISSENLSATSELAGNARQVPALSVLSRKQGENFTNYQLKFTFGTPLTFDNLAERPKTGALVLGYAYGGMLGWHTLTMAGYANPNHPNIHNAPIISVDNNKLVITRTDTLQNAFEFDNVKVYYIGNLSIGNLVENSTVFAELGKNFTDVNGNNGYICVEANKDTHEFEDLPELNTLGNYIVAVTYNVTGSVDGREIKKTFITYDCVNIDTEPMPVSGKDLQVYLLNENENKLAIKIKNGDIFEDITSGCFIKCWVYYLSNIIIGNLEENYKALDDIGRNFTEINGEVGYTIYDNIKKLPKLDQSGNYVVAIKYKNEANASETYVKYLPLIVPEIEDELN